MKKKKVCLEWRREQSRAQLKIMVHVTRWNFAGADKRLSAGQIAGQFAAIELPRIPVRIPEPGPGKEVEISVAPDKCQYAIVVVIFVVFDQNEKLIRIQE